MKKVFLFLASLGLTLTLSGEGIVKIAVNSSPYYNAVSRELKGMYKMIYEEAFAAAGYEVEFVVTPLQRGIQMLFGNKVDAHSPGSLYIRGENRDNILSVPVGRIIPVYVYYRPGGAMTDIPDTGLMDRMAFFRNNGLSLVLMSTSPVLDLFRDGGVELIETEDEGQQMRLLKSGRFDFALSDYIISVLTIQEQFPGELDDFGHIMVPPWDISLAFSRGNPRSAELYEGFSLGLDSLKKTGRYLEILELYWGEGNVPRAVLPDDLLSFGVEEVDMSALPSLR